jgi:uncharacterized membrane protein YesL
LNKKKPFKLFDLTRDGRGIAKHREDTTPGLKRFFLSYKNNFSKLVYVNIFYCVGNFPLFFLILALSGVSQNQIFLPLSDLFQNISGIIAADGGLTPYKLILYSLEGLQSDTLAPTVITYVFYAIGALTLFTFGPVAAGCAYILRNLVSGEPVFVWSDFWYALKRNLKQSIVFGIIDVIINAVLVFNLFTYVTSDNFLYSMMFWSNVIIFLLYFFMRYYVYVQMVTFKLTLFKIIKNSLIFSLVGLKRNVLALLGIVVLIILEVLITFGSAGVLLPLAVVAPIAILFSTFAYMKVYASYFKIKELMIDPYLKEHPEERPEEPDEEIIMHDDVTERERLEEIKRRNGIL